MWTDDKYILDGKTPVPCTDLIEWAKWREANNRTVGRDHIGDILISTVFLGLDHRYGPGKPILFETMVFEGPLDQEQVRYCTWDEAEKGHQEMIERVKTAIQ